MNIKDQNKQKKQIEEIKQLKTKQINTKYNIPRDTDILSKKQQNNKRILQRKDWQSVWRKDLNQKSKTKSQRTEKENQRIKPGFKISIRRVPKRKKRENKGGGSAKQYKYSSQNEIKKGSVFLTKIVQ